MKTLNEMIMETLEKDVDTLNACAEELDSWNGFLGDDRCYEMECLYEFEGCNGQNSFENLMNRIFYGHDESNGSDSSFNPNRDYFYYNGYGNLVSTDSIDYSDKLDDYMIQEIIDNVDNCNFPDEITDMIEEYEEEEDEEEEDED